MDITSFLSTPSEKPKLVVIYGPTACGKTALSLDIAKKLDTEIISADSRQIYRYLDIGTGKILPAEQDGISHHMLDIIDPDADYSVGEYKKAVQPIIDSLHARGKIPVLCGGTGLYIDSIIYNLSIPELAPDWAYREKLEQIRLEKGNEFLWQMLHGLDPAYASEIHPNNYRYVMR